MVTTIDDNDDAMADMVVSEDLASSHHANGAGL